MDSHPTLAAFIPPGIFVGTSLILCQGNRFLYGIRPPKKDGDRLVLELTGIGGGMEEEDDSFSAGVLREAQEEIGCDAKLIPTNDTIVVQAQDDVRRIEFSGRERPAALVYRYHRTPAHQPWHPENQGDTWLIIFLAELSGEPRPVMELPSLIWLAPEQILETARRDVPIRELLASGAELIDGPAGPPPMDGIVRLTDSQEALALALGDQTLPVYRDFIK